MRIHSLLLTFFLAAATYAAVPPDIATQLKEMGRVVNPAGHGQAVPASATRAPPYPGVKVERDIKYFDDDRTVLDVFSPEKGGGKRPVLIYVSGGAGNKIEPVPDGDAFYDNIMLWAVKNGMTGVNVQRRGGQGLEWDEPAKDIGRVIEWAQQNISKYKGNPNRMFIWCHSAGNIPVSTYVGHPELYGPKGVGVKGVMLHGRPEFQHRAGRGAWTRRTRRSGVPRRAVLRQTAKAARARDSDGSAARSSYAARPIESARLLKVNIPFFLASGELDPAGMAEFQQHPQGPALHGEELSDRDGVQGSQPHVGSVLAQHGGRHRHGSHPEVDEEREEVIVERA